MKHLFRGAVAAALLACVACGGGYAVSEPYPPPYAPAHGYRYHHDHLVLVYDNYVGAYRVVGYRNVYFDGGHYYRVKNRVWYSTSDISGGWARVDTRTLPPGLAKKYPVKYKGNQQAKKTTPHKKSHGKSGH